MAWRPDPVVLRRRHGVLGRYLLDGERTLTAVHQHWAKVAEPVVSLIGGFMLVVVLDTRLPSSFGPLTNVLWWAWFAVVLRAGWMLLAWRHDWFVATDKRLILTNGLITHKVAMMPLTKVTDMSYVRSPAGRILGYGTFVMESAGQDQALHRVRWVPNPDHTYRVICAEIFEVDDHDRVFDQEAYEALSGAPPSRLPADARYARIEPRKRADSTDSHDADTGPIHYWRRGTRKNPD